MNLLELIAKQSKYSAEFDKLNLRMTLKDIVFNSMAGMFAYKDLPDTIRPEFFEQYLRHEGTAALLQLDGEYIAAFGSYAEEPDVYGLGKTAIASTLNGIVKHGLIPDKDVVIAWNNDLMLSDIPVVNLVVDYLMELFTSLKSNIIYSRLKPVFRADDDKIKAAIEEAFKKISDNEPLVITSTNVMNKLVEGSSWEDVNVLNITDPENSNKLQYLVKCIDDVMRWAYGLYGQAIQGNGKLAQQTVDEVNGDTSISFIIPNNMLKQRKKAIAKFNELFGFNASVDFSKAWKTEETKYTAQADKAEAEADKMEAEAEASEETEETEKLQTEEGEAVEETISD